MNRRERLHSTLRGDPVDRPAVSFLMLNGLDQNPDNDDPFNIYSHPSWRPLIEMAREKTDRVATRGVAFKNVPPNPLAELTGGKTESVGGDVVTTTTLRAGRRTLTRRTVRSRNINTVWVVEHLLKDTDDLKAYLDLPAPEHGGDPNIDSIVKTEDILGDTGIVMLDTGDPICAAASMFEMGTYTVIAKTEPDLFQRLLDRVAPAILARTAAAAQAAPGRLWRICGPEYASPPFLPPDLFYRFVAPYVRPMVESIQKYGGVARVHSHGRLKDILDHIAATGCHGLDPIEPPPTQGDVELSYVRERYGEQMVLFGNIEVSELVNLDDEAFERRVRGAVRDGTSGSGRGFVLTPTGCPVGRVLPEQALRNYAKMIETVEEAG